ncbi:MAG: hypothetical protein ACK54I_06020 [Planctomycetota bacterium]|jgi:general secretion pathway protein I
MNRQTQFVFVPSATRNHQARTGLSLLEVLLAIAILGGAMIVITQLLNLGYRSAIEARMRTEAALLCDTKMAELAAGVLPLSGTSGEAIEENPNWNYSVSVENASQVGLLAVTVTVAQNNVGNQTPMSLSIVRLMPDPDYDPTATEASE